jgi:demethylmenaquinone methyltransferase/2-methoxy-6-polyprenyl-1,4-benzoquinol methylase
VAECQSPDFGGADEYAGVARFYDFLIEPFMHGLRKAVRNRALELGRRSFLDVACGTGRQLEMFKGHDVRGTGIDSSGAMLAVARKKTRSGISYVQGDASVMPFADQSFECASITFALHEMERRARAKVVSEMFRVLSPGGTLLVVDYVFPQGLFSKTALSLASLIERAAGSRHYHCYREFIAERGACGLAESLKGGYDLTRRFLFGAAGLVEIRKQ